MGKTFPVTKQSCLLSGDEICINADFENTCSRIVVPKAAIVSKHTYLANGETKVFVQKLSCVRGNHIISGMSDTWRGKTIRVRKIKPSILGCNILRVEYFLQVRVVGTEGSLFHTRPIIGEHSMCSCPARDPSPPLDLLFGVSFRALIPAVVSQASGIDMALH